MFKRIKAWFGDRQSLLAAYRQMRGMWISGEEEIRALAQDNDALLEERSQLIPLVIALVSKYGKDVFLPEKVLKLAHDESVEFKVEPAEGGVLVKLVEVGDEG